MIKQSGISDFVLPVRDLSDWDKYCMIVDENESHVGMDHVGLIELSEP